METVTTPDLRKTVAASPAAVGIARDYVSRTLRSWGLAHAAPDAALIADELVSNAVAASPPGSSIRLGLGYRPPGVVLGVWDPTDDQPQPEHRDLDMATLDALPDDAGPDDLPGFGGWGLMIVESLSSKVWVEPTAPHGKWLCALLNIQGSAPG